MPAYVSTDPNFGEPLEQDDPVEVGPDPEEAPRAEGYALRAGEPQSDLERAWETVRQAIFGSPEREELRDSGIALQPTLADLAETASAGALFAGGPAAGAAALARVPGAVGRVGRVAASHPRMTGAAAGAVPGIVRGDLRAAVEGGVGGFLAGGLGGRKVTARAAAPRPKALPPAKGPQPVSAAPATPAATKPAPKRATKTKSEPQQAPPAARPDPGKAAAAQHAQRVQFAKELAKRDPKIKPGEKVWMQLDDTGNPVKYLTPDQAAAAARKGLKTTWIRAF